MHTFFIMEVLNSFSSEVFHQTIQTFIEEINISMMEKVYV